MTRFGSVKKKMEMVCATSHQVCLEGRRVTLSFLVPSYGWLEGGRDDTNRSWHFGLRGHSHTLRNKIESGTWWSCHTIPALDYLTFIRKQTNKQKLLSCFRHRYFGFLSLVAKSNPNFTHWNIHCCIYLSGVILIIMPWSLSSILSYSVMLGPKEKQEMH